MWRAGGHNDTYGFALAAHPGKSQGRPSNKHGLEAHRTRTACPACVAPRCPRPGRSHRTHQPGRQRSVEAVKGRGGHPPPFIRDTNPLERLNREIGRRTDVVGIFPDDASLIRLATSLIIEQNDEWLVGRRYLSLDSLAPLLEERREEDVDEEVLELTAA